jgi:hypothetical protein
MRVYTRVENVEVEVEDTKALFAYLKTCNHKDNAVVVRVDGDADFFNLTLALQEQIQRAGNGAALTGGGVAVWNPTSVFADGGGWRFVLGAAVVNAQQPQVPPPPSPWLVRG